MEGYDRLTDLVIIAWIVTAWIVLYLAHRASQVRQRRNIREARYRTTRREER